MSYSILDAHLEFNQLVDEALQTRDIAKAFRVADMYAEDGDLEQADYWSNMARRWDREDWSYDESINN